MHDGLTDLPNRALFMDRLAHALERSVRGVGPVAVLFLDLDNFKYVNDSLGHGAGDRLLVEVAGRLRSCVRSTDTVARFGGDEFTVLLEDAGDEAPEEVARSMAENLGAPFALGGQEVFVGASVGIALAGTPSDRPEDLIRRADLAMYAAKRKGKAKYEVFDPSMDAVAHSRLKLENDLRRALGDPTREFEVYYQPKVELASDALAGFEALVRWKHPERGLVSPVEFIPVAEETGLVLPIGRRVLEESCRQAKAWQDRRRERPAGAQPLTISVNLSARQFQRQNLAQEVDRVLDRSGLPPSSLELEITETVIMDDTPSTTKALQVLKSLGVRLSIDDFGTGYSSLSYLKHLPVDCLKIDRSFVWGLGQDPEGTAIVSAIVNLARDLGIEVVAEGVESAPQLEMLRALGCNLAQGFYFSEPLDHPNASLLLESAPHARAGR